MDGVMHDIITLLIINKFTAYTIMDTYPLEDFWKIPSAFMEKRRLG